MTSPKAMGIDFPNLSVLFINGVIPNTIDNSAIVFIDAPIKLPLRRDIAIKAMLEVVAPEDRPNIKRDRTIGIPVKSNLSCGNHGNGIFHPENFRL